MKKKNLWFIPTIILLVFSILLTAAIPVTAYYETMINAALNAQTQKIIPGENSKIFYWTDYESEEDLVNNDMAVCRQVEAEGAALLLNKNNALPLAADAKMSLFSQSASDPVLTGTGSAFMATGDAVSLYAALQDSFAPGCVNQELWKFYKTSGYKRVNAALSGGSPDQYRINEVPWEKYPEALKATFPQYGDAAIVVLSRSSGEGADLPNSLEALRDYMTDGDYLQLCAEERALLDNLMQLKQDGVFKKVIVILNSSSTLQLDFIDDYDIDALLWVGNLGLNGIPAVADILAGKVNPSGRIVDTFQKDNHAAPAMQNYDAYPYTNAAELGLAAAQNNNASGIDKCNQNYVVYQEGIYVGYRYFETRYEDYVLGRGNAGDYDYDKLVAFPFGSGLSYTTFDYSDFKITDQGSTILAEVDVTNTGKVDGKHTVQIYFQSPYTQYDKDNQVEKASVEICGFDKKFIEAGKTEHFAITVEKEDLTSYDHMNAKTYIMDAGDYYFTVGTDAHNAVNNILMAKGADSTRMSGTGDAALTAKWTLDTLDTTTYAVSSVTGNAITNRFENVDLNKYPGAEDQTITYLTRSNWVDTFPKTVSLRITESMWADGLTDSEEGRKAIVAKMIETYYPDASMPTMGAAGNLTASMFAEKDADDPDWDKLISQAPYGEMTNVIYNGFHLTQPVPSIGLPGTNDENGPQGFTKGLLGGASAMAYTSEDVMAATYNLELIEDMGMCIGEDFLHATDGSGTVFSGIYGPGANIHRTPYSGRNFEYYSEDGWLAGKVAAAEVAAIQNRGVYVFTKHFALNDQEEGRYGISTWANEQAIRELYLEGFEGSVARGGGMGVMSSFNRLGVTWSGAHYGLMTGILREEWGMKGAAITDCSVMANYMDYRMGVLAGQDLWDGYSSGMATLDGLDKDPAIVTAVQKAVKHIAYSISHSHAMNVGNATIKVITPWWQMALYCLTGGLAVLTAGAAFMMVRSRKKAK